VDEFGHPNVVDLIDSRLCPQSFHAAECRDWRLDISRAAAQTQNAAGIEP